MEYVSLTGHMFNPKVCIKGAAKGTTNAFIDESKQMVGWYEVLIRKDCAQYMINVKAVIKEHTPSRRQFIDLTKTFAFICEQCGIRGRFSELALHSASQHSSLHLRVDHVKTGETLRPLPVSVYTTVGTSPCC